jgi:hypothetical protein
MEGRRQAPKRAVKEIRRVGTHGNVRYEHVLECGHSEYKPRASRAERIACLWCVKAEEKEEEMKSFTAPTPSIFAEYVDDHSASSEIQLSRVRASLASIMKVPLEAIEIVASENRGVLEIKAAYVFLSAGDISRLIQRGEMQ